MRIDLFNSSADQISSGPSSQKVNAHSSAASSSVSGEDRATLTSNSTSVASLVSTALSTPEVRQDKVDSLQQAISSGQYVLDPVKIAASMIDEKA
ncbi:flagellar biosynthesis anti-sigma factor FlgM [Silvibacterium bohemicum]|uniref:Negative regulator of flagellin synthesis n=1 Tax=Silvibacterium bohemicum TaxID=1577686 RepID=A0A841JWT5_9BACT|nr:flagellar biosynthesis anti-sigma factor FlgM [Silvibacterium bohemicum]MBB6145025.1 flagellar biosynthesis anti-sigma factor FlgM [Silvibacterium bohemicum]